MRPPRVLIAAALLGAVAVFAGTIQWLHDPDMFHHLALGREVATNGLQQGEPFLLPFLGQPLGPPPYWLGSLVLFGWQSLFGLGGMAFLPPIAVALIFLVSLDAAAPEEDAHTPLTLLAALLPLALAVTTLRARATARPEIFALLFLALVGWLLQHRRGDFSRTSALLPLIFLVWGNAHPSSSAGLAILFLHLLSTLATNVRLAGSGRPLRSEARSLKRWAVVVAACIAASFLTPSPANPISIGVEFISSLFSGAGSGGGPGDGGGVSAAAAVRMLVHEMAPARLGDIGRPWALLLGLTLILMALRWRQTRMWEWGALLAFAALTIQATRFSAFLVVVCAPISARLLGDVVSTLPERLGRVSPRRIASSVLAVAAVAHVAVVDRPGATGYGLGLWPKAFPVRGADYLEQIGFDGRLFNTFHFGGYLEWRGIRGIYQDGRGMFQDGTVEASMVGPSNARVFEPLDEHMRFDALLVAYPTPDEEAQRAGAAVTRALFGDSDWAADRRTWALVAFDDGGLLYLRRDGRYAEQAARDEFRIATPANGSAPSWLIPALLSEYRRSMTEGPACTRCRTLFATFALAAGRPAEAAEALSPALPLAPELAPEALFLAARAAEALEKADHARALYRLYVSVVPADPEPRRALARMAASTGDFVDAWRELRPNLDGEAPSAEDLQLAAGIARASGDGAAAARWLTAAAQRTSGTALEQAFARALAAEREGDITLAIQLYLDVLALGPGNAAAHSNLGFVLRKAGRLDDALGAQQRAVELDPSLAPAWYGLGELLADRGDRPRAAKAFRRYLELDASGYWAMKAQERLKELDAP